MNRTKYFFQKLLSLLRVRSVAGGLEISDQVMRLAYFDGKAWKTAAARLTPGVMEKGIIKDAAALTEGLKALRAEVAGRSSKKINIVLALSSVNIYSQVFALPFMEGEDLEKAVELNVQMVSPIDTALAYSGSQLLGRDEENLRIEMSAAFVEKAIVDEIIQILLGVGFLTVAVESRSLALMRVVREKGSGLDADKAYLLVDIDNVGLDFLVIRKGQLYFEYQNPWGDLMDENGQMAGDKFEDTLTASLRQVRNFYDQHWHEPLAAIVLSASAFGDVAEAAIGTAAALPVFRLGSVMGQQVSPEWLVVMGAALRGFRFGVRDKEINLLGEGARDTFQKEQLIHFMSLWRVLVPVALGILVLTFGLADGFLANTESTIAGQSTFNLQTSDSALIAQLEASSTAFNRSVGLVRSIESQANPKYQIIAEINVLAASTSVTVSHVSFQNAGAPILLTGSAGGENAIVAFKNALEADPNFGPVDLPLTAIQPSGSGFSFSMKFPLAPGAFKE